MPSWTEPTAEDVAAAVDWATAPHHERHFFERLENPRWIGPLRNRGLFDTPPAPEQANGGVRCRAWPQSRYLARMAASAPAEVSELFAAIDTKNWFVAGDMIDAVVSLPTAYVVPIASKVGDAVRTHRLWHRLDAIGKIAVSMAADGEAALALDLISRAFGGVIEREGSALRQASYPFFEALTDEVIPALAGSRPLDLVALLLAWLRAATQSEHGRRSGGDDFSYIWRPAIEEHEQNRDHDFSARLVGILRHAAELAARGDDNQFRALLDRLSSDGSLVARRLAIHLIAEFADRDVNLAKQTMLDRDLFEDYRVKHEYARLLGLRFGLLDEAEQSTWLSWVDAGPPADESAEPTVQARHVDYWKFCRLHWVHEHLTGSRRDFYERMHVERGVPELADLNVRFGEAVAVVDESPFSVEQLSAMGLEAAIVAAKSWRPEPGRRRFDGPSIEGFASAFQKYIAADVVRLSELAARLEGTSAPFVRAFLRAVLDGIKRNEPVQIGPVLALSRWILSRPVDERTSPPDQPGTLLDADWQWCRDAIGELVEAACSARIASERPRFDIELRAQLWEALRPLLADRTTSNVVNDRAATDPRLSDWTGLAINSPRGKAMSALWSYADWLASHLDPDRERHTAFPGTFEQMPEVRSALEQQLADGGAGFTGRAGFGLRVGLAHWLDANWLRQHAGAIFDLGVIETDPTRAYGWAAWNTFLFSSRPHVEFYRLLRDQFSYAVDQAAQCAEVGDSREGPFFLLGQHLMALYGRGDLGQDAGAAWEADNGLIRRLVTRSHVAVRTYAIEFVGISLQDADNTLPEAVKDRFVGLWERYWTEVGAADAASDPGSAVFGWWFSSGVFDPVWSIQQLERFVERCPKADPDHMIVKRLAEIAGVDPARAARIIDLLVAGDDEGWRVSGWADDAKTVLAVALDAGGEAQQAAEKAIDRLGKRGRDDFGELLAR